MAIKKVYCVVLRTRVEAGGLSNARFGKPVKPEDCGFGSHGESDRRIFFTSILEAEDLVRKYKVGSNPGRATLAMIAWDDDKSDEIPF